MPPHYGKFIAYFRVSTDRQGKSGLGLAAQRKAVMSYLDGGRWARGYSAVVGLARIITKLQQRYSITGFVVRTNHLATGANRNPILNHLTGAQ